jgi:hypothetical protein
MNGKSREGLTLAGMASHIASAILLYREGKGGTKNDCKLVVSHILRTYQRFQANTQDLNLLPATPNARAAIIEGKRAILEHAIPAGCVVNALIHYVKGTRIEEATPQVRSIIDEGTMLAWVTAKEHSVLNEDYMHTMPVGADCYPWINKWARYAACGVSMPEAPI